MGVETGVWGKLGTVGVGSRHTGGILGPRDWHVWVWERGLEVWVAC